MIRIAFAALLLLSAVHLQAAASGPKLQAGTVRAIVRAQEQMDARQYKAAEATLDACRSRLKHAAYDRAYLQSIYGYLYLEQERYAAALKAFVTASDARQLTGESERSILYNIAQLEAMLKHYGEAKTRLKAWMRVADSIRPDDYMLLANIELQLRHYGEAAEAVNRAIASAPEPVRSQYETLYYLQYEQQRLDAAEATLKKMLTLFKPEKEAYLQLSGLLLQRSDADAALAVLELAYFQGLLETKEELMQLSKLYLYNGIPFRAAKLMEGQERSERFAPDAAWYTLEARAWQQAREDGRALKAYASAAEQGDSEAYVFMAYLHAGRHNPDGVIDAAQKGIAAGVRRPDELRLLEGRALLEKGEYLLAKKVFDAIASDGKQGKEARQWLDYVDAHVSP